MSFTWYILFGTLIALDDSFLYLSRNISRVFDDDDVDDDK